MIRSWGERNGDLKDLKGNGNELGVMHENVNEHGGTSREVKEGTSYIAGMATQRLRDQEMQDIKSTD